MGDHKSFTVSEESQKYSISNYGMLLIVDLRHRLHAQVIKQTVTLDGSFPHTLLITESLTLED